MKKADIVFDSRDKYFKSPQGAVKAGTELTFRLQIACDLKPLGVCIVVKYDRHDTPACYEMCGGASAEETDFLEYTVTCRIQDTGLYWYHFEVLTEDRLLYIGRLDYNSEGLLLFTNDGNFSRKLELPATGLTRSYKVRFHGNLTKEKIEKLSENEVRKLVKAADKSEI